MSGLVGNSRRHVLSCRGSNCFMTTLDKRYGKTDFASNIKANDLVSIKSMYHTDSKFSDRRSEPTVKTKIRLSDQDLHCLLFCLYLLDTLLYSKTSLFKF